MPFSKSVLFSSLIGSLTCNVPAKWIRLVFLVLFFAVVLFSLPVHLKHDSATARLVRPFAVALSVAASVAATGAPGVAQAAQFDVVKVDDVITPYATFQSHNQKVVQNQYGIFMTYLYSTEPSALGTWRLVHSIDGGKSWGTIYRSYVPTKAPTLDTDENGSIYVIHSDFSVSAGDATFLRFDPEQGFRNPLVKTIPGGSAGKYTSAYDSWRKRLYYMNWSSCESVSVCTYPNFTALDLSGNVIFQKGLILWGTNPLAPYNATYGLHYPHLDVMGTTLYFAWTTSPNSSVPHFYRSILFIYSEDGGNSWKAPGGSTLTTPIVGDDTGPAKLVSLSSESGRNNWLSSFVLKNGLVHFMYMSGPPAGDPNPQWNQHYMRFSASSGVRDIDITPTWQGGSISLLGGDGFFSTEQAGSSPLFAVNHFGNSVGILKSTDSGASWQDHAQSSTAVPSGYGLYALSGNKRLTKAGQILGHFTKNPPSGNDNSVWFFRAPGVDRSNDPYKDWVFLPLHADTHAYHNAGHAYYIYPFNVLHGGDTASNGSYSKLRLFENGVELGPAHTQHVTIQASGGGRFSHWYSSLYFSASDNSDPRTNGRSYSIAIPSSEVSGPVFYGRIDPSTVQAVQGNAYGLTREWGTVGDSPSAGTISRLRLYEDGVPLGPAHTLHATIVSTGLGSYSHWNSTLYFSASDNSDPRANGRNYTWAIEGDNVPACGILHVEDALPWSGYLYVLTRDFRLPQDSPSSGFASPVRLFENGVELKPAHALHADIVAYGGGRFSDWNGPWLYFSTSDNTDPRTNGRIYSWSSQTGCP